MHRHNFCRCALHTIRGYGIICADFKKGKQAMRKCIEEVTALQLRLKKIIGQLTGVQKMLAEDVPCEDILTQLNAANGALHRLSFIVLEGHLRHCVREGIETGNADETIESFSEALESFSKMA